MKFKYGFEYLGVRYGWKNKKLYRLPFERCLKSYGLKEINPIIIGSTTCYNIQRHKLTINKIKRITTNVDWSVSVLSEIDCPF